jgi:ferrochelatase
MSDLVGLLIVNLGTPDSPAPRDVYRYLIEFLTDKRVIDLPWLSRQLLVRGAIVPKRYRQSASSYQKIWTEAGSPLKVYGYSLEQKLQNLLGDGFRVKLAMRYQNPSIESGINELMTAGIKRLIVLPLFPQYASATTGSVHQCVMAILKRYPIIPELVLINNFATHPGLIDSFCSIAQERYLIDGYDHILLSFHGLPQKHITQSDQYGKCLRNGDCCSCLYSKNKDCYSAQCYATARAIAYQLGLSPNHYSVSFQSRMGKDPWLQPYTSEKVLTLAKAGCKRLMVFSPSFVCDCLETLFEIGFEAAEDFKRAGGETLDLVPGLNDHPKWIQALADIVSKYAPRMPDEMPRTPSMSLESLMSLYRDVR